MRVPEGFGSHYLVDFHDCDPETIESVAKVEDILLRAAAASRATVVDHLFYQYQPFGVSGVVLIAESHFSVHTWPEFRFASVDIFSCGGGMDAAIAIECMRREFRADDLDVKVVVRGHLHARGTDSLPVP